MVTPLARYSKEKKLPVWLTFSGLFLMVILLLILVRSFSTMENLDLKKEIPRYQERISQSSGGLLSLGSKLGFGLDKFSPEKISQFAVKGAIKGLNAVRTIFSEIFLAMILLMFIIQSSSGLFSLIEKRFGQEEVARLQATIQKIEEDIIGYFGTKTAMSLGTAVVTGIVLLLFKAKFIYFSLVMIFLLNFIPIIGSLVAVVIVLILYVMAFGLSANVAWLFILLVAVQVLFGSILEPKIA